jgi:hypothetical protein
MQSWESVEAFDPTLSYYKATPRNDLEQQLRYDSYADGIINSFTNTIYIARVCYTTRS